MDIKPFSLEEAIDVCDDFGDLVDTEFKWKDGKEYLVDNVIISPHPTSDKAHFLENYSQSTDSKAAIEFYNGVIFDVVIAASDDTGQFIYINIGDYAAEKGITYHFPGAA